MGDVQVKLKYDYTASDGSSQFQESGVAKATVYEVKINEVSFSGSGWTDPDLVSDDGNTTYSAPHWLDSDGDGDLSDAGDRNYPVAYTRNTKPKINVKMSLSPDMPTLAAKIKASGVGSVAIPETSASNSGSVIQFASPVESNGALTNSVKHYDQATSGKEFLLNWEIQLDGVSWINLEPTKHTVYVTLSDPASQLRQETLFAVGCQSADGSMNAVSVLSGVLGKIAGRSVTGADGNMLSYYGFRDNDGNGIWNSGVDTNFNDPDACDITSADGLLSNKNGQCHSWAELMIEIMQAQGITSINGQPTRTVAVDSKPTIDAFAIKNWAKTGVSPRFVGPYWVGGNINPRFDAGVDRSGAVTPNPNLSEAADSLGVSGQGHSPNPPSHFVNHFIVKMNGKYYDPSYGLGPYSDRKDYETAAFDGSLSVGSGSDFFLTNLPNTNNDPNDTTDEICTYQEF